MLHEGLVGRVCALSLQPTRWGHARKDLLRVHSVNVLAYAPAMRKAVRARRRECLPYVRFPFSCKHAVHRVVKVRVRALFMQTRVARHPFSARKGRESKLIRHLSLILTHHHVVKDVDVCVLPSVELKFKDFSRVQQKNFDDEKTDAEGKSYHPKQYHNFDPPRDADPPMLTGSFPVGNKGYRIKVVIADLWSG